jgi:hypothetical protein
MMMDGALEEIADELDARDLQTIDKPNSWI